MDKVPVKHYQRMRRRYPQLMQALEGLGVATNNAGPLEEKTRHLVQLAAAAAVHSEGAVHSHVRRAREAGASPDEIRHALLLLVSTIGFPTVVAALTWADDVLGSE